MSDRGNRCQLFIVTRGKDAMRTTNPSLAGTLCHARLAHGVAGRAAFGNNDVRCGPVAVDVMQLNVWNW